MSGLLQQTWKQSGVMQQIKQGLPVKWFNDGDILVTATEPSVQWYLNSGKLSKITTGSDFEEWTPKPEDLFYKMASVFEEWLVIKLKIAKEEKKITDAEYARLEQMINSEDAEAVNLVRIHLENLNK